MSATVRAFIAVPVPSPPPLREVLGELTALGRPVKSVAAENLHVTVKFLGNTDTSWIARIGPLLEEIAFQTAAFDVTLRGLGVFPKPSRPSVIWTGMTPPEPMTQLAGAVEGALVEFGFAPESRTFQPHITVARVKHRPPPELSALLDRHEATEFATFRVSEIVLMQSELSPQGPRYTPLITAKLH